MNSVGKLIAPRRVVGGPRTLPEVIAFLSPALSDEQKRLLAQYEAADEHNEKCVAALDLKLKAAADLVKQREDLAKAKAAHAEQVAAFNKKVATEADLRLAANKAIEQRERDLAERETHLGEQKTALTQSISDMRAVALRVDAIGQQLA